MKKIFFLATALFAAQQLFAVPANPEPVEKTQSDGTIVTVRLRGDERLSWLESLDGYTLMNNDKLDVVFAVKNADGDLQPSEMLYRGQEMGKYSAAERASIEKLPKKLRYSEKQVGLLKRIREITEDGPNKVSSPQRATAPVVTNLLGEHKVLCILANFSDRTMVKSVSEFENLMNQVGYTANGNSGSVKDFYRANSYGKMDITVTVAGPVTLSNTMAYYGGDPVGERRFGRHVAQAADATVDFSQFAVNGRVPSFHIIFAGYGDESSGVSGGTGLRIWSHKWRFVSDQGYATTLTLDGVVVGDSYSCSPELRSLSGSNLTYIGVICHELCHAFGAPDYYDDDYGSSGGDFPGTGNWDLMAGGSWNNGGRTPAQINMFQKILFGWVNPIELTSPITITDMPNSVDSAKAYFVKANTNGEMYVLENRQQKGFDTNVPGYGLLIYHVHQNALAGNADNSGHPQQTYVVAAGSTTAIPIGTVASYGNVDVATATFGGAKTSFNGTSTPRMFSWNNSGGGGVAVTDKPITDISRTTNFVSFKFMGGTPAVPDAALTAILTPSVVGVGVQAIQVRLANMGLPMTSASIAWSVGGVAQTPCSWSGNLAHGASAVVTLGSVDLAEGTHTISATVTLSGDVNPANNTISKNIKAVTSFFFEDWEGTTSGWTLVNGTQTNKWHIGTAAHNGGTKSAYVSNNSSANQYTLNATSRVHLYRDIAFPASADSFDLAFDVKGVGEITGANFYDYLEVRVAETSNTPTAGTPFSSGTQIGRYNNMSEWQTASKKLPPSYGGTTKRLVFSWINDNGDGAQPPIAIDNIIIAAPPSSPEPDAALEFVDLPTILQAAGTNNVSIKVALTNVGGVAFTSASIAWSVGGVAQAPCSWSGSLAFGASAVVTLGTVNLTAGTHAISATVSVADDTNTANNTVSQSVRVVNAFFFENWEGAASGWTLANGSQTNKWYIGEATHNGGTKSAYISNNGSVNEYTLNNATSRVHLYRDISFPTSTDSFDLFFDVKGMGESSNSGTFYDYLEVRVAETSNTPTAGAAFASGTQIGRYNNMSEWQTISKKLPPSYGGTIKRLVFSWTNDYSDGAQPPAAVDNIIITGPPSSNNNLASLSVSSGTLSPAFNAAATAYTCTVPNSVSSLTITATAADANATVAGTGAKALSVGNNSPFQIVVTAQNGSTKAYTLTVTRLEAGVTTYTVTFNSQGGSDVNPQIVAAGSKAAQPTPPNRAGYIFDGWYKDSTYTTAWNFETDVVTEDITLYAKWTQTTSVSAEAQAAVKLYPNPVSNGQLIIDNEQWQAGEAIEIYSMSGALVATHKATGEKTSVNISQLPNGTYLLKAGRYTAKFVKQ